MRRFFAATALAVSAVALVVGVAAATPNGADTLVTVGSPSTPFPQNKQNEPAVAVNPADPSIAAAGVNEEIDIEACNNRDDKTCPFTPGIGTSGIYFSDDGGSSWMQPTYTGLTARDCLGVVGTQPANPADNCDPHVGPIGTLPRYFESGLVSDGDPAVGFGPQRGRTGSSRGTTAGGSTTRISARTSAPRGRSSRSKASRRSPSRASTARTTRPPRRAAIVLGSRP
jgi:hypothetical protein